MTVAQIAARLPAGFHDAELLSLSIDYAKSTAQLDFNLWTPTDSETEKYSLASLHIEGFQYIVIEPPLYSSCRKNPDHSISTVDGFPTADHPQLAERVPSPNDGMFAYSFFADAWNCCIHLAATSALLEPAGLLETAMTANEV